MSFVEDLSDFVPVDGPGSTAATYKGNTIQGIFERQFVEQFSVQTSAPTFLGKKSDLSAVAHGDGITINSIAYTVAQFEHDPVGYPDWTLLLLQV